MKPIIMKLFIDELDDVLTDEQKAIACSSHNGDTEHVAAAQEYSRRIQMGFDAMSRCATYSIRPRSSRPADGFTLVRVNTLQSFVRCESRGGNRAGYTLPNSPWFIEYQGKIREMIGDPDWEPIRIAKDGCGLPTVSNTVNELALLFSALVREKDDDDWIWDSMHRYPDLIGGFNRLDSTIIKAGEGRVLAKRRCRWPPRNSHRTR